MQSEVEELDCLVRKMHDEGWVHRKGFCLKEATVDMAALHLIDELVELQRAKTYGEKLDEAGDMLGVWLHLIYMEGLPLNCVVAAAERKLLERIKEPPHA